MEYTITLGALSGKNFKNSQLRLIQGIGKVPLQLSDTLIVLYFPPCPFATYVARRSKLDPCLPGFSSRFPRVLSQIFLLI